MLAIIQARMSSTRFPGKVLMPLHGEPILGRVIQRVTSSKSVERVIVATSQNEEDLAIYKYCYESNIPCFRGALENVADRFCKIMTQYGDNAVIRICGDSPFIDPNLISLAISHFKTGNYDLVTNVFPRSFPKGQSVEIIKSCTFLNTFRRNIHSNIDLEHVTSYFYKNKKLFSIYNFLNNEVDRDFSSIQLSVDSMMDYKRAEKLMSTLNGDVPDWRRIVNVLDTFDEA